MSRRLHFEEICAAVRGVLKGCVALAADTDGSDLVCVGSNRLFAVGDNVALQQEGAEEPHTVAELIGLGGVRLESAVSGEFRVAEGAVLQRKEDEAAELVWIAQGLPTLLPAPAETALPGVIVEPARLEQPLGEGTNRAWQQNYHLRVHYLERVEPGAEASRGLLERAGRLFDLLMQDPYLGGTAWYAQVTRFEPEPAGVRRRREQGLAVTGVEMELVAQRLEPGE